VKLTVWATGRQARRSPALAPACGTVPHGLDVRVDLSTGSARREIPGPHPDPLAPMVDELGESPSGPVKPT